MIEKNKIAMERSSDRSVSAAISSDHDRQSPVQKGVTIMKRYTFAAAVIAAVVVSHAGGGAFAKAGDASAATILTQAPLPPDAAVVRPAADVPEALAKLSGQWVGRWDAVLASQLLIERVTANRITVVYTWGRLMTPDGQVVFDSGSMRQTVPLSDRRDFLFGGGEDEPMFAMTYHPRIGVIEGSRIDQGMGMINKIVYVRLSE